MSPNFSYSITNNVVLWGNNSLSLDKLRLISKKLHKDNLFVSVFTKNLIHLIISNGFTLRIQTSDKAKRKALKVMWESFINDATVSGVKSLNDSAAYYICSDIMDGDILIYATERNGKQKLNHIPAHRVSTPGNKLNVIHFKTKELVDLSASFIDNGVVYDRGEVVGYTFSNLDSALPYLFVPRKNGESFSSILLQPPLTLDTDTVRGVPLLACAIKILDDITSLLSAETKVAKIRSKVAGVLDTSGVVFDSDEDKAEFVKHISESITTLEQNEASILVPTPGTKLTFPDKGGADTSSFELLIKPLLVFVAALYGVSYNALSNDLNENSGGTARMVYSAAWTATQPWRDNFIISVLDPFFELMAEYNGIDLSDVNWQINCRQYGFMKNIEEINANKVAIETNQKTLAEVAAESGKDIEDIIDEKAEIEKYQNSINPDYVFALDLIERLKDAPNIAKAILINKGYTQEVINTLYGI